MSDDQGDIQYDVRTRAVVATTGLPSSAAPWRVPGELVVQAQDGQGRLLFHEDGRPLLVRPSRQTAPNRSTNFQLGWLIALVAALLIALCIIGGVGLHYLAELAGPSY